MRATWLVRIATTRGIVFERGSPDRSSSAFRGMQDTRCVTSAPCVGQREVRRLGASGDQTLDVGRRDRISCGPDRDLVDLRREVVHVVADELEQRAAGLRLRLRGVERGTAPTPTSAVRVAGRPREAARPCRPRRPSRAASPSSVRRRRARGSFREPAPSGRRRSPWRRRPSTSRHLRPRSAAHRRRTSRARCRRQRGRRPSPRRRSELDRARRETAPQARHCAADLRPVGSRDQIRSLELVRHRAQA